MIGIWIALAVALTLLLIWLAIGYYAFLHTMRRDPKRDPYIGKPLRMARYAPHEARVQEAFAWFDGLQGEDIFLQTRDGLRLHAFRVAPQGECRGRILLFHGYRSCAKWDFSAMGEWLTEEGYELFFVSQRAHGKSEGNMICMGEREREDCRAWCDEILHRYGDGLPIALIGISMGAATVTMAAQPELPQAVKGIVADCGFSSPCDIIGYIMKKNHHLPAKIFVPAVRLYARIWAKSRLKSASSVEAVKHSRIPILLFHGDIDTYVPYEMGCRIAAARRKDVEFVTVRGAVHAMDYLVDTPTFQKKTKEFFARIGM